MGNKFHIGLSRKRKECRFCAPNKGGKLVCNNHYDFEDICSTFLVDYDLSRGKTKSWTIRQMIYTAVLCPVSEDCKQVRETITFEFFLVEWSPTFVERYPIFDTLQRILVT